MRAIVIFLFTLIGPMMIWEENFAQGKDDAIDSLVEKEKLPIPNEEKQLFYLQRDPNTNTVIYTLNVKDGEVDDNNPINAHWIRYAEGGERSDLSFIQRKFAYGVNHTKTGEREYDIRLQAYKDLAISVKYDSTHKQYKAFTEVKDREIILERIFVRIDGGSYFKPNIQYIEVLGYDPRTKAKISHRFSPD